MRGIMSDNNRKPRSRGMKYLQKLALATAVSIPIGGISYVTLKDRAEQDMQLDGLNVRVMHGNGGVPDDLWKERKIAHTELQALLTRELQNSDNLHLSEMEIQVNLEPQVDAILRKFTYPVSGMKRVDNDEGMALRNTGEIAEVARQSHVYAVKSQVARIAGIVCANPAHDLNKDLLPRIEQMRQDPAAALEALRPIIERKAELEGDYEALKQPPKQPSQLHGKEKKRLAGIRLDEMIKYAKAYPHAVNQYWNELNSPDLLTQAKYRSEPEEALREEWKRQHGKEYRTIIGALSREAAAYRCAYHKEFVEMGLNPQLEDAAERELQDQKNASLEEPHDAGKKWSGGQKHKDKGNPRKRGPSRLDQTDALPMWER